MSDEMTPAITDVIKRHLKLTEDAQIAKLPAGSAEQGARVVEYLNRLYKADPGAIQALMCHYIPANQALLNDHECVVINPPVLPPDCYHVGFLGLLNGMMHALGLPYVNLEFDGIPGFGGAQKLVGFRIGATPEG